MSAFVAECREEWQRLGVPDQIADEMASELETDLAEASADGVSAAELLGESDPRRFAATWASARGLVPEQKPRRRRSFWVLLAVGLALLVVGGIAIGALGVSATTHQSVNPPHGGVPVPLFVGLKEHRAVAIVRNAGLRFAVVRVPHGLAGVVVAQAPDAGARVRPGSTVLLRVGRGG